MQTERINAVAHQNAKRLLDLIEDGQVVGIAKLTIEQVEVGDHWEMQTLAIGIPSQGSAAFPIVLIDRHKDDNEAMCYAVAVFESLKSKGFISPQQAVRYRRGLITLVPSDPVLI